MLTENEKVRRFFNRTAFVFPIIEANLFPEYRRALRKLNLDSKLTVLDLATGTGILAGAFAERGHAATGYDFAEKMLKRARKKFPLVRFESFDLTRVEQLPDHAFDIVAMGYFLHGVPPDFQKQVLKHSARVATKYVIIFDYCCKGNWLVDFIEWIEGSYYNHFVSADRQAQFRAAGLKIITEINLSDYGSVWVCRADTVD